MLPYLFVCKILRIVCRPFANPKTGVIASGLGAIPLGSATAFLALTGSFIILTSVSYAIPFVANMLTGRKYFPPGPFHLGKAGYTINILAVLLTILFDVFFCFREFDQSLHLTFQLSRQKQYAITAI
jgi:choline transport protein